ncbi:hypothetical protein D1AOALGA4SA_6438 [Olavius algarvensis Delta 1 endosymbiont]|nr:hypothetical protein D1AOALGA4SA_6438 [Olavius algarvensis Delta 1 endosymbiont]
MRVLDFGMRISDFELAAHSAWGLAQSVQADDVLSDLE